MLSQAAAGSAPSGPTGSCHRGLERKTRLSCGRGWGLPTPGERGQPAVGGIPRRQARVLRRGLGGHTAYSRWETLSPGEAGTDVPRTIGCYPWPGTPQSRVTTAGHGPCPGWLRPPTFVPNSDGTVAAGEGLFLAGEPSRHVPGLRGKEDEAGRTQRGARRARAGPRHWEHGTRTACIPPTGSARSANPS